MINRLSRYDIVRLTYDIVDHDIVRTPRTTSAFDIVRLVRTILVTVSYDYDVARLNIRCRASMSEIYDIVRLTYDVVLRMGQMAHAGKRPLPPRRGLQLESVQLEHLES